MTSSPSQSDRALIGRSLRDGRFAISGLLGSGAQGATLEAVDKRAGQLVAIKRFVVRGARSWKDVELAEREAEVLSKLSHPLLPAAIEHFEHDGALYLVMEKIDGPTLTTLGTVDSAEVWRYLYDAAEVLDYLHRLAPPVIHRDIKPGNVIRRPARAELGERRPRYALVDFGSVRNRLEPAGGSTVVGTFGFMAPEQFQGRACPASDVYAVGVTALRMLTGVEPEDQPHRGLAIDVHQALTGGDATLCDLLARLLEPDPDKRPSRLMPLLDERQGVDGPGHAPAAGDARSGSPSRPQPAPPVAERDQRPAAPAAPVAPPAELDAVWLPPPLAGVATLALALSELAVWVVAGVAVPLALSLLAIVFGRPLRRAAARVVRAGARGRRAIAHARANIRSGAPMHRRARRRLRDTHRQQRRRRRNARHQWHDARRAPDRPSPSAADRGAEGPRISDPPSARPGARIIDEAVEDVLAEMESALDETLDEVDNKIHRRRRR